MSFDFTNPTITLVLTGALAGKDALLHGVEFKEGVAHVSTSTPALINILVSYHGAMQEGSKELEKLRAEGLAPKDKAPEPPAEELPPVVLTEMTNEAIKELVKERFDKTITGNRIQLIEQAKALLSK